ncbi:hypothetical protein O6H91_05G104200 [Diphasiastrum complanatum]|uniref:Uncharacterized protein n=1 Tax=Diphasiastrum complanatum TaxID=34168 RepID=A0ACC2DS08_DIPCM|nr:hypothetical protein O6H91_05G104200 [Diphasiastrum complanatum]
MGLILLDALIHMEAGDFRNHMSLDSGPINVRSFLENPIIDIENLDDDASRSLYPDICVDVAEWLITSSHESPPRHDHNILAQFEELQMPNQNSIQLSKIDTSCAFKKWQRLNFTLSSAKRTQPDQWMLKRMHKILFDIHAAQLEKNTVIYMHEK